MYHVSKCCRQTDRIYTCNTYWENVRTYRFDDDGNIKFNIGTTSITERDSLDVHVYNATGCQLSFFSLLNGMPKKATKNLAC